MNDSDPNVCFLLERNNKPKSVAATTESHPTHHPKLTPQEAKKVFSLRYISLRKLKVMKGSAHKFDPTRKFIPALGLTLF